MEELWDYVYLFWRSFKTALSDPTGMGTYAVIALSVVLMGGITYMLSAAFRRRKARAVRAMKQYIRVMKGKRMSVKEREEYEKFLVEDFITTGLEEMYFLGQINKERRDWWYRYFAERLKLDGLVRDVRKGVKEQIKRRIRTEAHKNVIPFPDPVELKKDRSVKKFKGGMFTRKTA